MSTALQIAILLTYALFLFEIFVVPIPGARSTAKKIAWLKASSAGRSDVLWTATGVIGGVFLFVPRPYSFSCLAHSYRDCFARWNCRRACGPPRWCSCWPDTLSCWRPLFPCGLTCAGSKRPGNCSSKQTAFSAGAGIPFRRDSCWSSPEFSLLYLRLRFLLVRHCSWPFPTAGSSRRRRSSRRFSTKNIVLTASASAAICPGFARADS